MMHGPINIRREMISGIPAALTNVLCSVYNIPAVSVVMALYNSPAVSVAMALL